MTRPPSLADLEPVAALLNACARKQLGSGDTTAAGLRRMWEAPERDLARDNAVVVAPDGQVAGYCDFLDDPTGHRDFEFEGYVHPAYEGRGIGTHLLRLVEARARESLELAEPGAQGTLKTSGWSTNEPARRLLGAHGFTLTRRWQRMLIEMDGPPPAPEWPAGISVRTFVPDQDDRAFHEAMEEGLSDEWGHVPLSLAEWRYYMVGSREGFDPSLYFMVMDGDQVAGGALCGWERPGEPETGHVRYLAVRRPWRGRGIGLALLRHIFGEFYRRGKPRVGLGVDADSPTGAQRLYLRGGMQVVAETAVFTKELT